MKQEASNQDDMDDDGGGDQQQQNKTQKKTNIYDNILEQKTRERKRARPLHCRKRNNVTNKYICTGVCWLCKPLFQQQAHRNQKHIKRRSIYTFQRFCLYMKIMANHTENVLVYVYLFFPFLANGERNKRQNNMIP